MASLTTDLQQPVPSDSPETDTELTESPTITALKAFLGASPDRELSLEATAEGYHELSARLTTEQLELLTPLFGLSQQPVQSPEELAREYEIRTFAEMSVGHGDSQSQSASVDQILDDKAKTLRTLARYSRVEESTGNGE